MGSTKGTPKIWVDKLLALGHADWVPPIARYDEPSPADVLHPDSTVDWHREWRKLNSHHLQEMDVLNAVIAELVKRLKKSQP